MDWGLGEGQSGSPTDSFHSTAVRSASGDGDVLCVAEELGDDEDMASFPGARAGKSKGNLTCPTPTSEREVPGGTPESSQS